MRLRKSSNYVWVLLPMRKRINGLPALRRSSRLPFAAIGAAGGFAVTILFALYNGALGIWYPSLWHGSIGIYYALLSLVRGILLAAERKAKGKEQETAESYRRKIFTATSGIVLAMNAALVTPVSLMALDQRPIQTGLIPAIASATYTTYKISAAAVQLKRANGTILDRELGMIRLVDALASVLVLQNTLIIAVDGSISPRLFRLVAIASAGILLLIFAVSAAGVIRGLAFCRKSA